MSEVRTPHTGSPVPPGTGAPLAVLAAVWGAAAVAGLVWATGTCLQGLVTGRLDPPPFGFGFVDQLVTAGPAGVWPHVDPTVLAVTVTTEMVLLVGAATAVAMRWSGRRRLRGGPARHMASVDDLAHMTRDGATRRARQLRPELTADVEPDDGQIGMALGRHQPSDEPLFGSWEDVCLTIMAPRSGKTTAQAVPTVLAAPGPVIATSNKADLWAATATLRAEHGQVWTFDPQGIVGRPQGLWWDPLAAVIGVEDAQRLAGHFVQEIRGAGTSPGSTGQDFWALAAADLLTALLLAAAADDRPIVEVYRWLSDPTTPIPAQTLRRHGHSVIADGLTSRQHGAPETRDGIYETARTAAQSLRNPQIAAWVTPPGKHDLPALDVTAVGGSTDTLYLHSKDGAGAAAPLVAALADQVLRAAVVNAERAGGRLDPPMVAVLDEAANICRIADLPELYSHLGSRGIVPVTILQSYRQGTRVWGEPGMDTLWSAATVKVIGAGIDDPRLAEDLSRMVGEHDVTVRADTYSRTERSTSLSLRRERILPPEDIRALPRNHALLLATGTPAALIRLQPWYAGPGADRITHAITTSRRTGSAA